MTTNPEPVSTVANTEELIKLIKKLPHGFQEEADAWSIDQLRNCIVESTHNLETAVKEIEEHEEFKKAKAAWKNVSDPVKDIKKAQKAKIQYSLHLLELKGSL